MHAPSRHAANNLVVGHVDLDHRIHEDFRLFHGVRLGQGALSWQLLHDTTDPARYVEMIEDESWTEHLRRLSRFTASNMALQQRKQAFHVGENPPVVTRYFSER